MENQEKKNIENLIKSHEIYSEFYKRLSNENINRDSKEVKIIFWKNLLDQNALSNDYYFFVYSVLTSNVKSLVGYDYLYGMSEDLRKDEEFEEMLIRLSGNGNLVNYISKINLKQENDIYKDSEYGKKINLQNKLMKRLS